MPDRPRRPAGKTAKGSRPKSSPKKKAGKKPKAAAAQRRRTGKVLRPADASRPARLNAGRRRAAPAAVGQGPQAGPQKSLKIRPIVDLSAIWDLLHPLTPGEFRVHTVRPDDLLVTDFIFQNLKLAEGDPPRRLVRIDSGAAAKLIVEFQPQSFGEEAFLDATGPEVTSNPGLDGAGVQAPKNVPTAAPEPLPPLPAAHVRMAQRSRLAFLMPADVDGLDYTIADVLKACREWPMALASTAVSEPNLTFVPMPNDFGAFDKDLLGQLAASVAWKQLVVNLGENLTGRDVQGLVRSLSAAGKRIAKTAATELGAKRTQGLNEKLTGEMRAELAVLSREFPALGRGARQDAALAVLCMASAEAFAQAAARDFRMQAEEMEHLPFLHLFLHPYKPSPSVTQIELPYRLVLSPIHITQGDPTVWRHSLQQVEHKGRTELWHTRLTRGDGKGRDRQTKARAIWSPDYPIESAVVLTLLDPPKPYRMSLDVLDRQMLVKLTAGFNEHRDGAAYQPRASRVQRLMLSALGGLLDTEGNWDKRPDGVSLEEWRHLATTGRDHYVRVMYAGYLWPFGHAASLVKVTERKFEGEKNKRVAALRQRFFIVVREPIKEFQQEDGIAALHQFKGRNLPFTSVEVVTRVTPSLLNPGVCAAVPAPGKEIFVSTPWVVPKRACFWPALAPNNDFHFALTATDLAGKKVSFSMPLLFVGQEANQAVPANVVAAYNLEATHARRTAEFGNAGVSFAVQGGASATDTSLPTREITFGAGDLMPPSSQRVNVYPETESAMVGVKAVQRMLNQPDAAIAVTYPDAYKNHGFNPAGNPGELFLSLLKDTTPFALDFGGDAGKAKGDAVGGLVTPSMAIQGLSRIMGPVAAQPPDPGQTGEDRLNDIVQGQFNPAEFFADAKILGGIKLKDLLTLVTSLLGADVPKLLTRELPATPDLPERIEASFDWKTEIKDSDPLGLFVPLEEGGNWTPLEISVKASTPIANPGASTFEADATLQKFKVNLFGFITIWFDLLKFQVQRGQKPDVDVKLHDKPGEDAIAFGGPLEFVNELRKLIPVEGFSDPPGISITPSGISASYSLNLPDVEVGIFALSNASLGAGFDLPFDAKPVAVRFNFCERQSPFSLTVSMLGGGGFFAITIGTAGVKEIEASLEFGAAVGIDLGVASGGVEIKAGVYFHWLQVDPENGSVELTGYIRLHGELSILGLISASLTFNLQLSYLKENQNSVVWGEATLEIEIEILFFSMSVSVSCRREFAGSQGDPKFIELIPAQSVWDSYCAAFAEEVA